MQLGRTLVGALIGAALGIGLLVVLNLVFRLDQAWLAIPVAVLVGVGVRTTVATVGHPSYARGAITGLLALATYFVGWPITAEVATMRAQAKPAAKVEAPDSTDDSDVADDADAATDAEKTAEPVSAGPPTRPSSAGIPNEVRNPRAQGIDPWDAVWLGIAAFFAYELGRGSASAPKREGDGEVLAPRGAATAGVHPDA